jgi:hypothetical protein
VPAALKLAEEHEDDLTILFVESQGLSQDEADAFALKKNWLGANVLWTTERPFDTGARGLPNCALLSTEGKVLFKGSPLSEKQALEETLAEQLNLVKKGPDDAPKTVRKAWVDFGKEKYASAIKALTKAVEAGRDDAEAAQAALDTLRRRIQLRLDRVDRMMEEGYVLEAGDTLDTLASGCKGLEEYEPRIRELEDKLESDALKPEIKAAESLAKLKKKIRANGVDAGLQKALARFAEKHEGTKAAAFARRLISLAEAPDA